MSIRVDGREVARILGGGGGIRTHETFPPSGFQDRRIRPLCHPSSGPGARKRRVSATVYRTTAAPGKQPDHPGVRASYAGA